VHEKKRIDLRNRSGDPIRRTSGRSVSGPAFACKHVLSFFILVSTPTNIGDIRSESVHDINKVRERRTGTNKAAGVLACTPTRVFRRLYFLFIPAGKYALEHAAIFLFLSSLSLSLFSYFAGSKRSYRRDSIDGQISNRIPRSGIFGRLSTGATASTRLFARIVPI